MTEKQADTAAKAIKAQLVAALARKMKKPGTKGAVSQSELARRMKTSRAVVHRLLKTDDTSLTLSTLAGAATALKAKVSVRFGK